MSTTIQIRDVPGNVHRKLKSRAALEGLSLSEYLLREVSALAERPSAPELRARLASRVRFDSKTSIVDAVRAERGARCTVIVPEAWALLLQTMAG